MQRGAVLNCWTFSQLVSFFPLLEWPLMTISRERISVGEFTSLVALLISLAALSIDIMLPALP